MKITHIHAKEILDSRGYPTVETLLKAENGYYSISSVPSGNTISAYEAIELRDGDPDRFGGYGVLNACRNVNEIIAPAIIGMDTEDQEIIDERMIELDGTENKGRLGANAILSVSEACLKLAAISSQKHLFAYIFDYYRLTKEYRMPQPTLNMINGGKFGNGRLEFQEFNIMPRNNQSFTEMLRMADEVYLTLRSILKKEKLLQGTGDEGGFTGDFRSNKEALDYILKAIELSNLNLEEDIKMGIDCAASDFCGTDKRYHISDRSFPLSSDDLIEFLCDLKENYNLIYIEDGLSESDWDGYKKLTKKLKDIMIVGDDLLTSNPLRVSKGINEKLCNSLIVKPNQIGTVTEFMKVIEMAKKAKWNVTVSHRSGETNDSFIADVAVGVGAQVVKFGAPARGERISKYNRLIEIEEILKYSK